MQLQSSEDSVYRAKDLLEDRWFRPKGIDIVILDYRIQHFTSTTATLSRAGGGGRGKRKGDFFFFFF